MAAEEETAVQGRLSPNAALGIAILAELAYLVGRTLIRANVPGMIATELVTTAWRLVSLAFYAWLFFEALKGAWRAPARRPIHPLLLAATVASVLIVLAAGYWHNEDLATRLVFAVTTPVVAMREELFYRFILQGGLQRKMNALAAIGSSSALFVLYHIGAQPMNFVSVVSMGSLGILLGVLYERTRSLRLVVLVHLIVDLAFIVSMRIMPLAWVVFGYLAVLVAALFAWSLDRSLERMGIGRAAP